MIFIFLSLLTYYTFWINADKRFISLNLYLAVYVMH